MMRRNAPRLITVMQDMRAVRYRPDVMFVAFAMSFIAPYGAVNTPLNYTVAIFINRAEPKPAARHGNRLVLIELT